MTVQGKFGKFGKLRLCRKNHCERKRYEFTLNLFFYGEGLQYTEAMQFQCHSLIIVNKDHLLYQDGSGTISTKEGIAQHNYTYIHYTYIGINIVSQSLNIKDDF